MRGYPYKMLPPLQLKIASVTISAITHFNRPILPHPKDNHRGEPSGWGQSPAPVR